MLVLKREILLVLKREILLLVGACPPGAGVNLVLVHTVSPDCFLIAA
jgi:hypothetical protein